MIVTLDRTEARVAGEIGWCRFVASRQTRCLLPGTNRDGLADIVGALGECATGKGLGLYWPAFFGQADHEGDLAGPTEVRTSTNGTGLPIRDRDRLDRPYVWTRLLDLAAFRFEIVGWCYGDEARRPEYRIDDPPPYWRVPRDRLEPLERFPYPHRFAS